MSNIFHFISIHFSFFATIAEVDDSFFSILPELLLLISVTLHSVVDNLLEFTCNLILILIYSLMLIYDIRYLSLIVIFIYSTNCSWNDLQYQLRNLFIFVPILYLYLMCLCILHIFSSKTAATAIFILLTISIFRVLLITLILFRSLVAIFEINLCFSILSLLISSIVITSICGVMLNLLSLLPIALRAV